MEDRPTTSHTHSALLWPLMVIGGVVLMAIGAGLILSRDGAARSNVDDAPATSAPPEFVRTLEIPDFSLVDQDGRPASPSIFDGRYTILAFTFTNCPTICPVMHAHLLRLQAERKAPILRTLTISVDPTHDTPEALRRYADRLSVDPSRWTMLTGDVQQIRSIARALKLGFEADESSPIPLKDGSGTMSNIEHSSRLVLVGPDRQVVDLASGLEWDDVDRLARLALKLAAASP